MVPRQLGAQSLEPGAPVTMLLLKVADPSTHILQLLLFLYFGGFFSIQRIFNGNHT
ncbi:hypothetical protein CPB83DRAFT_858239 [Crepidotus variabilis]|uniref:Uncharacterized protein n=1 Tax=Crepidotus variabilis TaxID=179855 RepID=A0A9P6EBS9_9AGAR|nr:hypothetical protein CPB83DRAFT_858239 [Crepidotus variabilis]